MFKDAFFPTKTGLTHWPKFASKTIAIKQHDKGKRKAPKLSDLVKTSSMNLNKEARSSMMHKHSPSYWLSNEALADAANWSLKLP